MNSLFSFAPNNRPLGVIMKLRIDFVLIGLLIGFLFSPSLEANERDSIKIVSGNPVKNIDPAHMTSRSAIHLSLALYEGLTVNHPKTLKPLPGVAKRWTVSPDGRTWTFYLRKNAHWVKDGKRLDPVSADDFHYAWFRLLRGDVRSPHSYMLHFIKGAEDFEKKSYSICEKLIKNAQFLDPKIKYFFQLPATVRKTFIAGEAIRFGRDVGVKAIDSSTLQVTLKSAVPYFLDITSSHFMCPVYKQDLSGLDQYGGPFNKSIVANGAFFMSQSSKTSFKLDKNKHYWDAKKVSLNSIFVNAISNPESALAAYLKGTFDWAPNLPFDKIKDLSKRDDFISAPAIISYFFRVNVKDPIFSGKRGLLLRRALSLSVHRQKIIDKIVKANQKPAYSIVPPGFSRYQNYHAEADPEYSSQLSRAKDLMAKAGYPNGLGLKPLTILFNQGGPHRAIAKGVVADWKKIGVIVRLEETEWNNYLDRVGSKRYQIARSGWIGDFTDPATFLDMWVTNGRNNNTAWSNPRYDRLIKYAQNIQEILSTPREIASLKRDVSELKDSITQFMEDKSLEKMWAIRQRILRVAEEILVEEGPLIPIYFYTTNQLWNKNLKGLHGNIRDLHPPKFWSWRPRKAK